MGDYTYNVGDRVRLIIDHPDGNPDLVCGSQGSVAKIIKNGIGVGGRSLGVIWDAIIHNGHNLGYAEYAWGHGWWVSPEYVEPECPPCQDFEPASCADIFSMLGMK